MFQPMGEETQGETSPHFVCGRRSWQACALLICVFINYVCARVLCMCVCAGYSSQAVWAISRWVSSLTLWTCVFVCAWGSGVMWCEAGKWRIGSVVCVRACYWGLRLKLVVEGLHCSIFRSAFTHRICGGPSVSPDNIWQNKWIIYFCRNNPNCL